MVAFIFILRQLRWVLISHPSHLFMVAAPAQVSIDILPAISNLPHSLPSHFPLSFWTPDILYDLSRTLNIAIQIRVKRP